jgi:hypothetical protein
METYTEQPLLTVQITEFRLLKLSHGYVVI